MNIINNRIQSLNEKSVWSMTKQSSNFDDAFKAVLIFEDYKVSTSANLENYFSEHHDDHNLETNRHRVLIMSQAFGLLTKTPPFEKGKYENEEPTKVFYELKKYEIGSEQYNMLKTEQMLKFRLKSITDGTSANDDFSILPLIYTYQVLKKLKDLYNITEVSLDHFYTYIATSKKFADLDETVHCIYKNGRVTDYIQQYKSDSRIVPILFENCKLFKMESNKISLNEYYEKYFNEKIINRISFKYIVDTCNCTAYYLRFLQEPQFFNLNLINEIRVDNVEDKDTFSWIDFYKEFATVLLNYKNNRRSLLSKFEVIFESINMKNPFLYDGKGLVDVCPFTVFGTFNRGLKEENRINILKQIKTIFSMESDIPHDFNGIPVLSPLKAWFFTSEDGLTEIKNGTIDLLWDFFEMALNYSDNNSNDNEIKFIELFNKLIEKPLIKWNITMGLFWIRPEFYINLDSKTREYLSYLNLNGFNYKDTFKTMINGQQYVDLLKYIKKNISDNTIKEKSLCEISYNAWSYKNDNQFNDDEEALPMIEYQFKSSINSGENRVVYGTPGCGKSYYVQNTLLKGYSDCNVIRTTFYQDYTNTDFIGQILPIVDGPNVSYQFIPGPFSIALAKALEKPEEQVALVVEELNRGNAASIFGDIFQLLDRETKGENKGRSIYSITNVNLQKHLTKELKFIFNKIMIPSNLSIYATMNTSDQNVFTLDTAFKRRWNFEKLSNKFEDYNELYGEEHPFKDDFIPGMFETWKDFVDKINKAILDETDITKSEDKLLGIFFIDETGLVKKELVDVQNKMVTDENKNEKVKEFAYKIFEYLWDDVLKYCRENWFGKEIKSLDDLIKEYIKKADKNEGDEVFVNGIIKENK